MHCKSRDEFDMNYNSMKKEWSVAFFNYKEKAIDDIVLYLHYLQGNYQCDLIRAFCGKSEWTLREEYLFAARDPDTVILPKNVCHPDKMLDLIIAEINEILSRDRHHNQAHNISSEPNDFTDDDDHATSKPERKTV